MKFPIVIMTRKRYDTLIACARNLCNQLIVTEDERDQIIGNACRLADIEREDRRMERENFQAIYHNIRGDK